MVYCVFNFMGFGKLLLLAYIHRAWRWSLVTQVPRPMAGMSYPELSLKEPALDIVVKVFVPLYSTVCDGVRTGG